MADVAHLIDQIQELPPERGGLRRGERLVVGLSGGADSIALTGLLHELATRMDLQILAAHLDHQLRADSAEDREFCQSFCNAIGVELTSASADVRGRAADTGEGIEAAGRRARHDWLEQVRVEHGYDRIALAHHLDDHAETLLMWLGRGTGLSGLTGIEPARDRIVRPLRSCRREDLRAECRRRGWSWREDPTNADQDRVRNRLRASALPALEQALGPGSLERMGAMSARASAERAALAAFATDFLDRTRIGDDDLLPTFDRAAWRSAPQVVVFQALRAALADQTGAGAHQRWNEARYRDVLEFIRGAKTGQQTDLPGGGVLEVTRNSLRLHAGPAATAIGAESDLELRQAVLPAPPADTSFWGRDRACFDAGRVTPPFNLRKVRPGDRMQPFGMSGQKKLVRLLAENAVARHDRWSSLVVEDQERIVWAVGLTTSEHTRITEDTQQVLQLSLHARIADGKGSN